MDHILELRRHALAEDQLGQDKDNPSAVERREGEQVEKPQADGKRGDQLERPDRLIHWIARRRSRCRAGLHIAANGLMENIVNALETHEATLLTTQRAADHLRRESKESLNIQIGVLRTQAESLQR